MLVGCVLNGVLPESLVGLSDRMEITEAKVDKLLKEHFEKQLRGDAADNDNKWLLHCKEVVRLSVFFRLPERRWQIGAVLLGASIVDRLHWEVLGFLGQPKLSLSGLVDPSKSRLTAALAAMLSMMLS